MSQDNIYTPPVIRPELLQRWRAHQEEWYAEYAKTRGTYRDHGRDIPFEPMHRWRRFQKADPPPPRLVWKEEKYKGNYAATARWVSGDFRFVARQLYSDEGAELGGLGEFTSKVDRSIYEKAAVWVRGARSLKRWCRWDQHNQWREGVYDRTHGGTKGHDRNKHTHIVLDDYSYTEIRDMWWLQGYSKHEADLLARKDFKDRVEYLDDIDSRPNQDLLIQVFHVKDEDEDDELDSIVYGSLLDYDDEGFTEMALDIEDDLIRNAKARIRRRLTRYQSGTLDE